MKYNWYKKADIIFMTCSKNDKRYLTAPWFSEILSDILKVSACKSRLWKLYEG